MVRSPSTPGLPLRDPGLPPPRPAAAPPSRPGPLRHAPMLALGLLTLAAALHGLEHWHNCDDAFISFRYAENLVRGHGLVFNPGERVEGYTNFLWVMLLAAAHALGAATPLAARVMGSILGAATVPVTWRLGRLLGLGPVASLGPCLVVAASAPVAFWAGGGLETALYMLLLSSALGLALRDLHGAARWPLSGPLFALAALTRPEAAGLFAVTCLWALLSRAARAAVVGRLALGFCVVFVPHLAFRLLYYGLPLPNTVYAKAVAGPGSLRAGLGYLGAFFAAQGPWALPALAGLFLPGGDGPASRRGVLLPAAVLGAAGCTIAIVGGDFYPYWRFCAPYVPWIAVLVCAGVWRGARRWLPERGIGASWRAPAVTLALAASMALPARLQADAVYRDKTTGALKTFEMLTALGHWLRAHRPPTDLLAISTVGRVPYYSRLPTLDMLGITDAHIAHAPGPFDEGLIGHRRHDSTYVLARRPDIVVVEMGRHIIGGDPERELRTGRIHAALVQERESWWPAVIDLLGRRDFRLDYAPHLARVAPDRYFVYFERDPTLRRQMAALAGPGAGARSLFALAMRQRRQGLTDDAVATLRRVAALDADNVGVRLNLGFFLLEAGQHDRAIAAFEALELAHPGLAQAAWGHAEAAQTAGRFGEAVRLWDAFLRRFPGDALAGRAMRRRAEAERRAGEQGRGRP